MTTYYRIHRGQHYSPIIHSQRSCPRLRIALEQGAVDTLDKKPWNCTICDHCQALDARDKRLTKAARPMGKRGLA